MFYLGIQRYNVVGNHQEYQLGVVSGTGNNSTPLIRHIGLKMGFAYVEVPIEKV